MTDHQQEPQAKPRLPILLAGATAVGKSAVAVHLGEMLRGEIVTVDSMQVYRGLDIGTAKPRESERRRVPHHLIDVVDIRAPFDVAQFCSLASEVVEAIQGRNAIPILCGGTGLYFKAWLEGIGAAPPANAQLRAELEALPLDSLLQELRSADPELFARIDRKNPRRVIRAVEVLRLTGRPFSQQRAAWSEAGRLTKQAPQTFFVGLQRAPEDLRQRIDRRVEEMFEQGLVEETRGLLASGLEENPAAMQAIGYRQVVEYLHGERSLPETILLVKQRTRQYAKRQMTWFRRQADLQWLSLSPDANPHDVAGTVATMYQSR